MLPLLAANVAPQIDSVNSATIRVDTPWQQSITFHDPGSDAWTWFVDFGDGKFASGQTEPGQRSFQLSHTFATVGARSVLVTVDDGAASHLMAFALDVSSNLHAPSDIQIAPGTLPETTDTSTADTLFGILTSIDFDPNESFTYELIAGTGDEQCSVQDIRRRTPLRQGTELDFETKPNLSIRVRTTDHGGRTHEKKLLLQVTDEPDAQIVGRHLFYNRAPGTLFSSSGNAEAAIDPMKSAPSYPAKLRALQTTQTIRAA